MPGVRGQGRKFDIDHALDIAMEEFWLHGYEATSVATLTKKIGIAPPSLYAAFGDKQQLFESVIAHYLSGPGGWMERAFREERSAATLVRRLLFDAAKHYADPTTPRGCLIITAGVCVTDANESVAQRLRQRRNANVNLLAERLKAGQRSGEIPSELDCTSVARFIGVTVQGMSSRARDGDTQSQLADTARLALCAVRLAGDASTTDSVPSPRHP